MAPFHSLYVCHFLVFFLHLFVFAANEDLKKFESLNMLDASDVTWAHAVNSREDLDRELTGNVSFLEADVLIGRVKGMGPLIPIMAHPPMLTSDISLDEWLGIVTVRNKGQGVKLDFKSLDVVEPSLKLLQKYSSKLKFPLWLNADILPGPVNSTVTPISADIFLNLCHHYFPEATLSLGWTTYWFSTVPPETMHYDWNNMRNMVDTVFCSDVVKKKSETDITFPVRGVFATRSLYQLKWLLQLVPRSSLTVWSSKIDPLTVDDLLRIRKYFPKSKVYYDIPEPLNTAFQNAKKDAEPMNDDKSIQHWIKVSREEITDTCVSRTYINSNSIVFGKLSTTAVLLKDAFVVKDARFQAKGYVVLFDEPTSEESNAYELSLAMVDVSLFSKNDSSYTPEELYLNKGDANVIWSAVNSSIIYKFDSSSKCYAFNLDTSEDQSFQVWKLSCDVLYEDTMFEEKVKEGKQLISSRERLVLPNVPVMFALQSSGEKFAAVYDIEISGKKTDSTSAGTALSNSFFVTIILITLSSIFIQQFLIHFLKAS